jgi:hypothetical protein
VQAIATVTEASLQDYEESLNACVSARKMWMLVCCSLSLLSKGMLALQIKICMLTSLSFG